MLALSPRKMLIARMQAFAYSNVMQGNMEQAEQWAVDALTLFDGLMEENPADSPGFWANRAFERFERACADLG
jgi:hypothetical protein